MFLPNLDGDFVDVSGRGEDGCGGSGRGRRSGTGLLTFGCSGCTARASCCFCCFGRHFLKEGVWSWFWIQDSLFVDVEELGGEDEGTWVAMKGSKSERKRFCLVYSSFTNRLLLLQLRV